MLPVGHRMFKGLLHSESCRMAYACSSAFAVIRTAG